MIIGAPKEIKESEYRVSVIPAGVEALAEAGRGSGIDDREYKQAGASISSSSEEIYKKAELIVKVKEPLPQEYGYLREGQADLLIGAVLSRGAKAPVLVSKKIIGQMKPGSVIIDVAVDQGGCVETSRPTTHDKPTCVKEGVVHYCVSNMPGAVARTSTHALANATFPYIFEIASKGIVESSLTNSAIAKGINMAYGKIAIEELTDLYGLPCHKVADVLSS